MRPIPVSALSETISIAGTEYTKVLVENHRRFMPSNYGASEQSNYLLIADATNTPNFEQLKNAIKIGVSIGYNDKQHVVKELELLHNRLTGAIHHIEVLLL